MGLFGWGFGRKKPARETPDRTPIRRELTPIRVELIRDGKLVHEPLILTVPYRIGSDPNNQGMIEDADLPPSHELFVPDACRWLLRLTREMGGFLCRAGEQGTDVHALLRDSAAAVVAVPLDRIPSGVITLADHRFFFVTCPNAIQGMVGRVRIP